MRKGSKQNSGLNGEWAAHVRRSWKKATSRIRRNREKIIIFNELKEK
jgi:hypothetical protein